MLKDHKIKILCIVLGVVIVLCIIAFVVHCMCHDAFPIINDTPPDMLPDGFPVQLRV